MPRGCAWIGVAYLLAGVATLVLLPGAGHFFHGRLADVTEAVTEAFGAELAARGGSDAA